MAGLEGCKIIYSGYVYYPNTEIYLSGSGDIELTPTRVSAGIYTLKSNTSNERRIVVPYVTGDSCYVFVKYGNSGCFQFHIQKENGTYVDGFVPFKIIQF